MPSHDISCADDLCQAFNTDHDIGSDCNDEDTQFNGQSRITAYYEGVTNEDPSCMHKAPTPLTEELRILRFNEDCIWVPIKQSNMLELFDNGVPTANKGWISETELSRWLDALVNVGERTFEAMALLAETVDSEKREYWHSILSHQEAYDFRAHHYGGLQGMLSIVLSSSRPLTDTDWWRFHYFYIPSQGMYHSSLTSNLFQDRIVLDPSPGRPWEDLGEVMRITLPRFRELNARVEALSKLRRVDYYCDPCDSPPIFGSTISANIIACLDLAESIAKMVPVLGEFFEGACGVLRKITQAAQDAHAASEECKALAEHATCITLAILTEIGATSTDPLVMPTANIFDLYGTISEVERRISHLSKIGHLKYFMSRRKINADVKDLRRRIDNARIAFKIRSDISTSGLLYDLRVMQNRLISRVEDIHKGQRTMHHMLHEILCEVRGRRCEGASIQEID